MNVGCKWWTNAARRKSPEDFPWLSMTQDIEKVAIWPPELAGSTREKLASTDNGIVAVTTHLYDGKKSVPLDIEIYQPASSLAEGKEDKEFKKKPEIAIVGLKRSTRV